MMSVLNLRGCRYAAIAMVIGLTAAACGGSDDSAQNSDDDPTSGSEITLSYAFFAPITSFPGRQMEEWAEQLNVRTDGRVSVDLFPGGTLLGTGDILDGVRQGAADVGMESPAYDVGRFPVSSVMSLPLGFENAQVASLTMLDLIEEYEPEEFAGFEVITAFTTEPGHIQSTRPVASREDLDGMQLRGAGGAVPSLQALGASPVGMPMPEVSEALQTGAIDGYSSSREVLQDFGLAEQVGYVTDYSLGISATFVAVMDREAFDTLPADVQGVIHELRREMTIFASSYHDGENVAAALEFAEQHGVETVELDADERSAWDSDLDQVIDDWLRETSAQGLPAEEILNRARELRDHHAAELGL
jgi:TRAP-type transport system periplasmic protein